jgi:hypothetical protein
MTNTIDYTNLLATAKMMHSKMQYAKDYETYVNINHKPSKTRNKAKFKFHLLENEYKQWKKNNIDKRGLILKTAGDCEEPIGIFICLAGSWDVPLECIANRWVVTKTK